MSTFIASALVTYSNRVEQSFSLFNPDSILEDLPDSSFDYIINTAILKWQREQKKSGGIENQLIVQIEILGAETGKLLDQVTIDQVKSAENTGFNYPCELVVEPLEVVFSTLYSRETS